MVYRGRKTLVKVLRSQRAAKAGALLIASILIAGQTANVASAHMGVCMDDPVVSLVNLGQIDLHSAITDSSSDVQKITYVVHVPAGTRVLAITNLDALFGLRSTVQVIADDAANTFDTYTTITTGQKSIAVTASSTLVSLLNVNLGSSSVSGTSGQTLHTHFKPLL
jgi:hypothetical protein